MRNILFIILISLVAVSCGKQEAIQPDVTETERQANPFMPALEIFPGTITIPTIDADLGSILNGPGTGSAIGTPWADFNNRHWSVATALQRDASFDCQILFRFLGEGGMVAPVVMQAGTGTMIVRLPRVAACYFEDGLDSFVEVTIIYQFWDEGVTDDWEIGIIRMGFNPSNILSAPLWTVTETMPNADFADIQPDIAYNPNNGDLYVVSVVDDNAGDTNLLFTHGRRNSFNSTLVAWQPSYPAQKPEGPGNTGLNTFSPSIDVGKVDLLGYANQWMIAFGYTANNQELGWHIRLNYWSVGEVTFPATPANYTANDFGWDDPVNWQFPAGNPVVDIGPPGSNQASIVWMQAKSDEWSNSTVMYADSHDGMISYTRFHPDPTWGMPCSAFPSVAVHQYPGFGNYRASVSFLFCNDYVTGIWRTAYMWVESSATNSAVALGPVTFNPFSGGLLWTGDRDSGAAIEHDYGMSSALTVYGNNYWMTWSAFQANPLNWTGGPTSVWGAYGNTN